MVASLPQEQNRRGLDRCRSRPLLLCYAKSDSANVLRLRALGTLRDVELDLLVLVEGLVALRLDGRVVNEDVIAAVLLGDEAEALLGVEPLHGALCHVLFLLLLRRETATSATSAECG